MSNILEDLCKAFNRGGAQSGVSARVEAPVISGVPVAVITQDRTQHGLLPLVHTVQPNRLKGFWVDTREQGATCPIAGQSIITDELNPLVSVVVTAMRTHLRSQTPTFGV